MSDRPQATDKPYETQEQIMRLAKVLRAVRAVSGPKQSIGQLRNRARIAGPELRAKLEAQIARMEAGNE